MEAEVDANTVSGTVALKTDAITDIVSAIFAKTGITADGSASYEDLIKALYAMARGKITKSGDAYTYFDDDGTTELFTLTISSSERATS